MNAQIGRGLCAQRSAQMRTDRESCQMKWRLGEDSFQPYSFLDKLNGGCFFCLQVFRLYRIETPTRIARGGLRGGELGCLVEACYFPDKMNYKSLIINALNSAEGRMYWLPIVKYNYPISFFGLRGGLKSPTSLVPLKWAQTTHKNEKTNQHYA